MKQITFHFHKGNALLSKAIRFFSQGKFNHVSIQIGNTVWEAHIDTGVRKVNIAKKTGTISLVWADTVNQAYKSEINIERFLEEWTGFKTIKESIALDITDTQAKRVITFLNKQVGKKYDTFGALSVVWRMFKQGTDKWYCSELGYVALMKALGVPKGYNQRVSPQEFYEQLSVIIWLKQ